MEEEKVSREVAVKIKKKKNRNVGPEHSQWNKLEIDG